MVVIVFHIEAWGTHSNQKIRARSAPPLIPYATHISSIDAAGTVNLPRVTLPIPYNILPDTAYPNSHDIIFTSPELSVMTTVFISLKASANLVIDPNWIKWSCVDVSGGNDIFDNS